MLHSKFVSPPFCHPNPIPQYNKHDCHRKTQGTPHLQSLWKRPQCAGNYRVSRCHFGQAKWDTLAKKITIPDCSMGMSTQIQPQSPKEPYSNCLGPKASRFTCWILSGVHPRLQPFGRQIGRVREATRHPTTTCACPEIPESVGCWKKLKMVILSFH